MKRNRNRNSEPTPPPLTFTYSDTRIIEYQDGQSAPMVSPANQCIGVILNRPGFDEPVIDWQMDLREARRAAAALERAIQHAENIVCEPQDGEEPVDHVHDAPYGTTIIIKNVPAIVKRSENGKEIGYRMSVAGHIQRIIQKAISITTPGTTHEIPFNEEAMEEHE